MCGYNLTDDLIDYTVKAFKAADPDYRVKLGESLASKIWTDEIDNLRKSKVQICFIAGVEDNLIDLNYLDKLDIVKWRDRVHWIEQAGHMVNWDQPSTFNKLLNEYFYESWPK